MKDLYSVKDWAFLSAFPYHVGLWMSDQDKGGGDMAQKEEHEALREVVKMVQRKYENSQFISTLMNGNASDAVRLRDYNDVDGPIIAAPRALSLIKGRMTDIEINCFKLMCLDIAEAVARASGDRPFGTHNLYGGPDRGWFGLYPLLASLMRLGRGPKVSQTEKDALNGLIDALKAEKIVAKWKPWIPVTPVEGS